MSKAETKSTVQAATPADAESQRVPVKWDTSNMVSSYANVCNANSTREEVVLNSGIKKSWERGPQGALGIELGHRVVLSPFAAKRLTDLLQ